MRRCWIAVVILLVIAGSFRAWLMAESRVAFESDEAVVGLMARHITHGEPIPTFFYGQAYMGSLDALLVAGGFRILGESVQTIRVVQLVLYLLALMTGCGLAFTVTGSRRVAAMALLLLALPTPLGALYTTITLGGYNEIIVLGNVVLLLGWQVTVQRRHEPWRWAMLGLAAGIGWWCNGAIVTACLVVGVMGLRWFSARQWRGYALAVAGFLAGSAPWWLYNLRHDWGALDFLMAGQGHGAESFSPGEVVVALIVLGLPALYGLRFPWESGIALTMGIAVGAMVYLLLVTDLIAGGVRRTPIARPAHARRPRCLAHQWVWLVFGVFTAVFTLSSFVDATGRYLMPLWVPAAIGVALGLDRMRRMGQAVPVALLALLVVMQAGGVIRAAHTGVGLTPQLVERLRTPLADDSALIAFMRAEQVTHGYASYWTSFRVTFRTWEQVILDTALPHDDRGPNPADNRYAPYTDEVRQAERVVWVTQDFPDLDTLIAERLAAAGITVRTTNFGHYRVYSDFSARVAPAEIGIVAPLPFAPPPDG